MILDDGPLSMAPKMEGGHNERMNWEVTEKTRLGGTGLYGSKYAKK